MYSIYNMDNITYKIFESSNKNETTQSNSEWHDIPLVHKRATKNNINDINDDKSLLYRMDPHDTTFNEICAREMDYDINYNIKYLIAILEYYGFKKGKLKKQEIISKIATYESEPDNILIVENRKKLFENFIELKNHPFFKKFILKGFT